MFPKFTSRSKSVDPLVRHEHKQLHMRAEKCLKRMTNDIGFGVLPEEVVLAMIEYQRAKDLLDTICGHTIQIRNMYADVI